MVKKKKPKKISRTKLLKLIGLAGVGGALVAIKPGLAPVIIMGVPTSAIAAEAFAVKDSPKVLARKKLRKVT